MNSANYLESPVPIYLPMLLLYFTVFSQFLSTSEIMLLSLFTDCPLSEEHSSWRTGPPLTLFTWGLTEEFLNDSLNAPTESRLIQPRPSSLAHVNTGIPVNTCQLRLLWREPLRPGRACSALQSWSSGCREPDCGGLGVGQLAVCGAARRVHREEQERCFPQ